MTIQSKEDHSKDDQNINKAIKDIEVEKLTNKVDEYLNGWKRALADYDNAKKEYARRINEHHQKQLIDIIKTLLPIIDLYAEALQHVPQGLKTSSWFIGFEQLYKKMMRFLEEYGVQKIKTHGETFNPQLHEALDVQHDPHKGDHTVVSVISNGYMIHDTVIRPAKVIVNETKN